MRKKLATIAAVLVLGLVPGYTQHLQPNKSQILAVPNARYLFGISAAPGWKYLLLFGSDRPPEGESIEGNAILIGLSPITITNLHLPPSLDDSTVPVWSNDGKTAYIVTDDGIYRLDLTSDKSDTILKGHFAGLAISPDDNKIAFWNLTGSQGKYLLCVYDLQLRRVTRSWNVPFNFSSDQYGHELTFSNDNSVIFARTYDEVSTTPLKEFNIHSGMVQTIWRNALGLAASGSGIYFIGRDNGQLGLYSLSPPDAPHQVIARFPFDVLLSDKLDDQLLAANTNNDAVALVNPVAQRVIEVRSGCDNANVFRPGQIVCSRGGTLDFETP